MAAIIYKFSRAFFANSLQKEEEKQKTGKKQEINRVIRKKEREKDIRPPSVPYARIFISLAEEKSEPEQFHWPDRP